MSNRSIRPSDSGPTFRELFTPKLVTVLREGYGSAALRADAIAGLTVAVVALPLAMAIAIASGSTPERGLLAAIVGGFLVSALGGSRFQVGGPAGAFIVLVAAAGQRHGLDGLLLATTMAGIMLIAAGFLRLGTYVKYIPYPVTVGFTAGIAVIIFASQIRDLLGLRLTEPEPGELLPKIVALAGSAGTINLAAVAIAAATIALIVAIKRWRPQWPAMLIAVAAAAVATSLVALPVETIGTRFGSIPAGVPVPQLPVFSLDLAREVLPDAVAFALLGAIESLLSAVVADGMTGRRHRSNSELVAQGVANLASAAFGALPVTGTIARTATNVRAGARGPVAGMLHSLFLLVFLLVAAPLASHIPLAALAGVLAMVAWTMAERHAFAGLLRASRGDAVVLMATFGLTIFRDLATGIFVGFALGTLLFLHRMAQSISVEAKPLVADDQADGAGGQPYDGAAAARRDVLVVRVSGAFFFGAAAAIGAALDRLAERPKTLILDFTAVPFLDSSAARTIAQTAARLTRNGAQLIVTGASTDVQRVLLANGVGPPAAILAPSIEAALPRAAG